MDDRSELERGLGALYVAVRDSAAVDRQAAFDIAMNELEYFPLHAQARELAEASLAEADETRLVTAAAAFLDACGYEPGFEQAPERFARLERALDAVRADMRATGLTGDLRLVRPDWTPGNAAVETWAGDHGWTGGISSSDAADDLSALVAVAEQARQAIMESLGYQSTGAVWPACPAHGLGTSPGARHGTGVWWCRGGDGHVFAEIGHLAARHRSRLREIPCLPAGITRRPGRRRRSSPAGAGLRASDVGRGRGEDPGDDPHCAHSTRRARAPWTPSACCVASWRARPHPDRQRCRLLIRSQSVVGSPTAAARIAAEGIWCWAQMAVGGWIPDGEFGARSGHGRAGCGPR